jgi:beta-phosphoglucomutase
MIIKGVIFGLDGVFVNTEKYHSLAWKEIAESEGIEFTDALQEEIQEKTRFVALDIILAKSKKTYSITDKIQLADQKTQKYISYLQQLSFNSVPFEVREMLGTLKSLGYRLAVGSSSHSASLILKNLNLFRFFDIISDGNSITQAKPDPEVFLNVSHKLDIGPQYLVVVDASKNGIDAGIAGGFITIGIGEASQYEKARYSLNSLNELLYLLKDIKEK